MLSSRVLTWKSIYKPREDTGTLRSPQIAVRDDTPKINRRATKPQNKHQLELATALSDIIPSTSDDVIFYKGSAFYRSTPKRLDGYRINISGNKTTHQIAFHRDYAEDQVKYLKEASEDNKLIRNIASLVLLPGVDTKLIRQLVGTIKPEFLTIIGEQSARNVIDLIKCFGETLIDIGIDDSPLAHIKKPVSLSNIAPNLTGLRYQEHDVSDKALEWVSIVSSKLERLSYHSDRLNVEQAYKFSSYLTKNFETDSEGNLSILDHLEISNIEVNKEPLDPSFLCWPANTLYATMIDVEQLRVESPLTPVGTDFERLGAYARISAKYMRTKPFNGCFICLQSGAGAVWSEIPDFEVVPNFKSNDNINVIEVINLRSAVSSVSIDKLKKLLLYPDGSYMQGYWDRKSLKRSLSHYTGRRI